MLLSVTRDGKKKKKVRHLSKQTRKCCGFGVFAVRSRKPVSQSKPRKLLRHHYPLASARLAPQRRRYKNGTLTSVQRAAANAHKPYQTEASQCERALTLSTMFPQRNSATSSVHLHLITTQDSFTVLGVMMNSCCREPTSASLHGSFQKCTH